MSSILGIRAPSMRHGRHGRHVRSGTRQACGFRFLATGVFCTRSLGGGSLGPRTQTVAGKLTLERWIFVVASYVQFRERLQPNVHASD
jgi:hypothetical protein